MPEPGRSRTSGRLRIPIHRGAAEDPRGNRFAHSPDCGGVTAARAAKGGRSRFLPYVSQEIWEELGREGPVFRQSWPAFDPELAKEDEAEIVVQVNGKLRSRFHAPFGTPKEELEARARADEKVRPFMEGKHVVRIITVADELVNIVVK